MKFSQKNFWELAVLKNGHFEKLAILHFFLCKKIFFCFILMKISHKLCDRMDGTQFWCFTWFPANSLLCVILSFTVYSISVKGSEMYRPGYLKTQFCKRFWTHTWSQIETNLNAQSGILRNWLLTFCISTLFLAI